MRVRVRAMAPFPRTARGPPTGIPPKTARRSAARYDPVLDSIRPKDRPNPSETPSAAARSEAAELFYARAGVAGGGTAELEELCAERPDLAAELRELDACYRAGLAVLAPPAPELPDVIDGRYEVRRVIESGGMGTVLEVWDRDLRRPLALKLVRGARGDERARRRSRLRNEAQVLGQLVHPAILPVHDVGEDATCGVYFTMQLVRGRHLGDSIDACGRGDPEWSATRLVGILHRICEAMAYAHSRGVVHRDLKPTNVMVGPFGETYVLDWGLARPGPAGVAAPNGAVRTDRGDAGRADPAATGAGDVVGTPVYMSPEQAHGEPDEVDERADVYSAGAILYHALCGRRPYADSGTPEEALRAVRSGPPEPLPRSVPPELAAIARRAMQRDRERRYPSMRAMADDLRAYLEGRVVRAHRTGALVELRKWVRRNRGAAAAVLTLLAGLAAVLALEVRANRTLRARDYRNKVALAAHAYERDDVPAMNELLDACPRSLRGWEWRAIRRLSDASELTLAGHRQTVLCAAFAPDGRALASGGADRTLRLWDLAAGDCARVWELEGPVSGVAFLDERRVLAATGGRLVELDVESGEPSRASARSLGPEKVALALSPAGDRILVGDRGRVELWSAATLEPETVLVDELFGVEQVAWSPDGRLALAACWDRETDGERDSLVRVFDARSGALVHGLAAHRQWVGSVAASPDGELLASAGWDGRVRIWELSSGALRSELPRVWSGSIVVAWGGDDSLLVGGRPSIEVWDVAPLRLRRRLVGHAEGVVALASRGSLVASAGRGGKVRIWSESGPDVVELPSSSAGRSLALRPGSTEVAMGSAVGSVTVWDAATRERLRVTPIPCRRTVLDYTFDGDALVTGDRAGRLALWEQASGTSRGEVQAHRGPISCLDAHPRRPRCVTGGVDGTVRLWDLEQMRASWTVAAGTDDWPDGVHGCVFSPDGRRVAVGANDGRLRLLDAESGALLRELRIPAGGGVYGSPVFSPDGRGLTCRVWDGSSRLASWDLETGALRWTAGGARLDFEAPCYTEDGARVLACNETGDLMVFDARSGETLATLPATHSGRVRAMISRGDVVVGATEGDLRFWDGRARGEP